MFSVVCIFLEVSELFMSDVLTRIQSRISSGVLGSGVMLSSEVEMLSDEVDTEVSDI